jgi:hypothetical protein
LAADLVGSGSITAADMKAIANMAASLAGSGEVDNSSDLKILAWLIATLTGQGEVDAASTMKGFADMSASITVTGGNLTAGQVAAAVWDEVLASHQDTGSTGKALNDAGSAGNPWSADADTNNDPGTMGEKLNKIKKDTSIIPAAL